MSTLDDLLLMKECDWCSEALPMKYPNRKYCSTKCRSENGAARKREKNYKGVAKLIDVECKYCRTIFQGKTVRAQYCSRSCNELAIRERNDPGIIDRRRDRLRYQAYKAIDRLVELNARQAWRYWISYKATDEWMSLYYEAKGKPWNNPRLSRAQGARMRYRLDEEYQLKERIRRQLNKAKKRDGIADVMRIALNNKSKSSKVEIELGYTISDLKLHIERQFTRRMNWTLFKDGKIHIDHIIPQASFDLQDDKEWKTCWSLANLMPLWAKDNFKKSASITRLL